MTEPQIQATENYSAIAADNENAMDDEPTGDDEKTEYEYSEDYDDSTSADNQQRFILAPTPAQLGRAPLQRRLGNLGGGDANSMHFHILFNFRKYLIEIIVFHLDRRSTTNCQQRSHFTKHATNNPNTNFGTIGIANTKLGCHGRIASTKPIVTNNAKEIIV